MEWYTWVFSGIGGTVVGLVIYFFPKRKAKSNGISQSIGDNAKSKGAQTFSHIEQSVGEKKDKK